jgi:hypothetical protein
MHLKNVTKGKIKKPYCILVYSADGVGKSTFASEAPTPIFLGPEAGTDQLDVTRFPQARTWTDIIDQVKELIAVPDHSYETLVIDTMDWCEPILWAEICKRYGTNTIDKAAGGYGKGYNEALKEWDNLKNLLNRVREERKMNIILLGHSEAVDFIDPMIQSNYIRYQLKLHKRAAALWREWVDAVMFASFETYHSQENGKTKAFSDGIRILNTERRAGWDAKNRYGLPLKMEFNWQAFHEAAQKGQPDSPKAVRARIDGLISAIKSPDLREKVIDALSKCQPDDLRQLMAIEQKLALRLSEEERETT